MKYLFKALIQDGSIIEQNPEDKSPTNPDKNCFYDVLQKMESNEVRAFAIYNRQTGEEYLVDLQDGRFEVNGVSFFMHNEEISNIRLIYFIRNLIERNIVTNHTEHKRIFNLGFQASDASGNNLQRIMTLPE